MSRPDESGADYRRAIELARADLSARTSSTSANAPELEDVLRDGRRALGRRHWLVRLALLSSIAAWVLSVVAHPISPRVCAHLSASDIFEIGVLPVANALLCLALLHQRRAGAQMYVRASCWSFLVLGTLSTMGSPGIMPLVFPVTAVSGAIALAALGFQGIEPEHYRGAFVPAAHRRVLTWMMILAVADMQSLVTVNQANHWGHPNTAACSAAMVLAVVGLSRLKAWGLWLNLIGNVIVAVLAAADLLSGVPRPLQLALCVTAVGQLALAAPVIGSIFGKWASVEPVPRRWIGGLAVAALVATTTLAVVCGVWGMGSNARAQACAESAGIEIEE